MLDVEIFDLISSLTSGNDVQEFSQAVLLQILFSQVFQVSLGEGNVGWNCDLAGIAGNSDIITQMSDFTSDFDSCLQELGKVVGVEDLIFNGFWAVDGEVVADFLLLGNSFTHGYKLC